MTCNGSLSYDEQKSGSQPFSGLTTLHWQPSGLALLPALTSSPSASLLKNVPKKLTQFYALLSHHLFLRVCLALVAMGLDHLGWPVGISLAWTRAEVLVTRQVWILRCDRANLTLSTSEEECLASVSPIQQTRKLRFREMRFAQGLKVEGQGGFTFHLVLSSLCHTPFTPKYYGLVEIGKFLDIWLEGPLRDTGTPPPHGATDRAWAV